MSIKRIAIIGISGSGKSTFSRKLAERTGLPLYHMDQLFWKGNWQEVPEVTYLEEHKVLIAKDTWIIEGWIDKKMKERLERADLVIYLDYSGLLCAWRVIKRWLQHRKESRPELPKEALERFKMSNVRLAFTRGERKDAEAALQGIDISKVIRVRSPGELRGILNDRFTHNERI